MEQEMARLREKDPDLRKLTEHLAAHPDDIDARLAVAKTYLEAGLYYPAYQEYQRVRATAEPRADVERGLALIWDKWGDYALAHTYAVNAVQLDRLSAEAWDLLARIELHRGDFAAAVTAFKKAENLGRGDAVLFANLGYALLRLNRLDQARTYLEQAIALNPALPQAHNHLGIVLVRLGLPDLALAHFKQTSEPAVALSNLGAVYLEQGQREEARKYFREALALKADYGLAQDNLRAAESWTPPPARVNVSLVPGDRDEPDSASQTKIAPEARGLDPIRQETVHDSTAGGSSSAEPPPSRVVVSIAPVRPGDHPVASDPLIQSSSRLEPGFKVRLEPEFVSGNVEFQPISAVLPQLPVFLYQPALPAPIRPFGLRAAGVVDVRLLLSVMDNIAAPLDLLTHPGPVAVTGQPGADLSIRALQWQEQLRDPAAMTPFLAWPTTPRSEGVIQTDARFYVPSLADLLLAAAAVLAVLAGLFLARSAGARPEIGLTLSGLVILLLGG